MTDIATARERLEEARRKLKAGNAPMGALDLVEAVTALCDAMDRVLALVEKPKPAAKKKTTRRR